MFSLSLDSLTQTATLPSALPKAVNLVFMHSTSKCLQCKKDNHSTWPIPPPTVLHKFVDSLRRVSRIRAPLHSKSIFLQHCNYPNRVINYPRMTTTRLSPTSRPMCLCLFCQKQLQGTAPFLMLCACKSLGPNVNENKTKLLLSRAKGRQMCLVSYRIQRISQPV